MFDPKPTLMKYNGQPAPFEIKGRALNGSQQVMASPWSFKQYGESGRPVSELLPDFAQVVDEVAYVRSMTTDRIDHSTAQFTFVTGRGITGFPSIGAWIAYGLGTENQNLPAFIALKLVVRPSRRELTHPRGYRQFTLEHDGWKFRVADVRHQAARRT